MLTVINWRPTTVAAVHHTERPPKLTTLATVEVKLQIFLKSTVLDEILEESSLIFGDARIPIQHTVYRISPECSLYAKTSPIS